MDDPTISRVGPRADLGIRFVAALIDGILVGVAMGVLSAVLGLERTGYQGLSTLASIVYFAVMEGMPAGQTIGKKAMKIRVIDFDTGGPIETRAWVRSIVRVVSGFACGLGFLWALWDPQKQTWHDKAAGSVVVPVSDYPIV